jgi:hypothetical protein
VSVYHENVIKPGFNATGRRRWQAQSMLEERLAV